MPLTVVVVMAAVLVLRLAHLSSSVVSPLTFQLGPDEDYYYRFALAILAGHGDDAQFLFMDPLYGYLVAALFRLVGPSVPVIFALQCVLDTATAVALLLIGRELDRPKAGLIAAALYGLTSTALMFSCALLKEVWVCAYVVWWVLLALKVSRSTRAWVWMAFGIYCGLGVSLRSTTLLFVLAAFLLPLLTSTRRDLRHWGTRVLWVFVGAMVAVAPWSVRNQIADRSFSPLPNNSGIVLHQAYNAQNPASAIWIPAFVNYLNPREIWRGYAAEAERRTGHPLAAHEVNAFWKAEALAYITTSPHAVASAVGAKALKFFAAADIPINRSLQEEALFSPVIRYLPLATPWLIALGLVGITIFARTDRRWLILSIPIVVSLLTVSFFWAEDRFRYHAVPMLALGAGLLIEFVAASLARRAHRGALLASGSAVLLLGASFALARNVATPTLHWDQIVWGYIRMNNLQEATRIAQRVVREQPHDGAMWEAVGYLAVLRQDFDTAESAYRRAVLERPHSDLAHFDLAKVLDRRGQRAEALEEANRALALRGDDPDYRQLAETLKKPP